MRTLCKILVFVLCIGAASGCKKSSEPTNQITKTTLTSEEKDILALLDSGGTHELYDYTVPECTKSVHFQFYLLDKTKNWKETKDFTTTVDATQGRFLIAKDPNWGISLQKENGTLNWGTTANPTPAIDGTSIIDWANTIPIELEKEYPLF